MPRGVYESLDGEHFGRLTVLGDSGKRSWGSVLWECECVCGRVVLVRTRNLQCGQTTSCGCRHREIVRVGNKKRGERAQSV